MQRGGQRAPAVAEGTHLSFTQQAPHSIQHALGRRLLLLLVGLLPLQQHLDTLTQVVRVIDAAEPHLRVTIRVSAVSASVGLGRAAAAGGRGRAVAHQRRGALWAELRDDDGKGVAQLHEVRVESLAAVREELDGGGCDAGEVAREEAEGVAVGLQPACKQRGRRC